MFENFLQNKNGQQQVTEPEEAFSEPENQDGLGAKYLLKIDELPSEQSDGEKSTKKRKIQVSETPNFMQERNFKKNMNKQFADLNFPKIIKQ